MKKRRKRFKKIICILLVGLLAICGCSAETSKRDTTKRSLTVGPWLAQINDEFGMSVYESETPYTDVGRNDPYFADVQIACEWSVLTEEDKHIKTSDPVTEEFAAKTLVRAVGFENVDGKSDEEIYQLAQNEGYINIEEKDGSLSQEEADSCLADVSSIWRAGNYASEPVAEYTYTDNTADLSGLSAADITYDISAKTVTVPSSSIQEMNMTAGVGVIPDENGYIQAVYIESITDNGDKTVMIRLGEGVPDLDEIFTAFNISVPQKQQNLLESLIYDGNGNLVHDGISEQTATSIMFQTLSIGTLPVPIRKDLSYTCNFGDYQAVCTVTSDAVNVTVSYRDSGEDSSLEIVGQFEINQITPSFDQKKNWVGFPEYARAQVDYNVVQKLDISAGYSTDLKLAPYNNGNGKFATNLKKAVQNGWKKKDAPGAQNIKIGTLDFWIFTGVRVRLDMFLNFAMDGSISISVSQAQEAGIEYRDGKLRTFYESRDRQTQMDAKVNMDASLYMGLSFYLAQINLVGFGVKPGIRVSASAQVFVADKEDHLLEFVEGLVTDEERLATVLGGVTDVTCYSCFTIEKLELYGQLALNEDSLVIKTYKKIAGSYYQGSWEILCLRIIDNAHFEEGKSVPSCTRTFAQETSKAEEETELELNTQRQNGEAAGQDGQITDIIVGKIGIKAESVAAAGQEGKQYQIRITEVPKGYSTDNLKYTSGDTSIASVTDKGVVTANKVGATLIYVQTPDEKYGLSIGIYISK